MLMFIIEEDYEKDGGHTDSKPQVGKSRAYLPYARYFSPFVLEGEQFF